MPKAIAATRRTPAPAAELPTTVIVRFSVVLVLYPRLVEVVITPCVVVDCTEKEND